MAGLVYSGPFEQMVNEYCNQANIAATAQKFKELEKQYGAYTFGKFMKHFMPRPEQYAGWDRDSGEIAESVRQRLTEVISANLKSDRPLPMVLKVGENVDLTHDVIVKIFSHKGQVHIGLHMLCPNTSL